MRLVLHIDLDAFYAQVEQIRLGLDRETPLAVQQWANVLAINYPARKFGVSRQLTATDCRAKCPSLALVHVATMSIDEEQVSVKYYPAQYEGTVQIENKRCKACLDPYRRASREIFNVIKDFFAGTQVAIEKASVDEAFIEVPIDFAQSYGSLEKEFRGHPIVQDSSLSCLSDQDELIKGGTLIAEDVRTQVYNQLGYTMSAGIAKNKTLAKLASPRNKPNGQTFVLDRHIEALMKETKFSKIRFLGGKLGASLLDEADDIGMDEETDAGLPYISDQQTAFDLQSKSIEELILKTGDRSSAEWVYNVIRGQDNAPVIDRSLVKSFLSAKQFRPPLRDVRDLQSWLRLFCAELFTRMEEEWEVSKRRPNTITLTWRRPGFNTRSKSCGIKAVFVNGAKLYDYAVRHLLEASIKEHGTLLPVNMLGVQLTRFSTAPGSHSRIDQFLTASTSVAANVPFSIVKTNEPDRWQCPRCAVWYSTNQSNRIQEHSDYHMALDIAKGT